VGPLKELFVNHNPGYLLHLEHLRCGGKDLFSSTLKSRYLPTLMVPGPKAISLFTDTGSLSLKRLLYSTGEIEGYIKMHRFFFYSTNSSNNIQI
jgi:hypothetical protein